jgi:hypothetical protein
MEQFHGVLFLALVSEIKKWRAMKKLLDNVPLTLLKIGFVIVLAIDLYKFIRYIIDR